jgi:hypothetical protein
MRSTLQRRIACLESAVVLVVRLRDDELEVLILDAKAPDAQSCLPFTLPLHAAAHSPD